MDITQIDFKKEWKQLYNASAKQVEVVEVPPQQILKIEGMGNPNTAQSYKDAVETLFGLSYALRFAVKAQRGIAYTVLPLEGLWWLDDMGEKYGDVDFYAHKDEARWIMLIVQPEYVTADMVAEAIAAKHDLPAIDLVRFETYHEGLSAQIMHIGSYDDEKPTMDKLHGYIDTNGYALTLKHHEIYLSDPRRVVVEKLKTIIRQPMR
jgi:hypothetical protein